VPDATTPPEDASTAIGTAPTAAPAARTADPSADRIVWIDCEMTGLDLVHDALVEVAALVTDSQLQILGEGVDLVIRPPDEALAQMNEVVRTMHTTSGLLDELAAGTTLADAEEQVLAYVREWAPTANKAPLAGNSVGTDRGFLARDLPGLDAHLHYRIIDVSSIKELARRWFPRAYFHSPKKAGGHRALADIRESIAELRYYREAVFVPEPGPDTPTAKQISARHTLS
jgi:oligoribonuclease